MDTEKPKELPADFWKTPIDIDPLADYAPHEGAEIQEIVPFSEELETIVKQMREAIPDETKILEGTLEVEYKIEGEFVIPMGEFILERMKEKENELSEEKTTEE